jgi:hypothetical protein
MTWNFSQLELNPFEFPKIGIHIRSILVILREGLALSIEPN